MRSAATIGTSEVLDRPVRDFPYGIGERAFDRISGSNRKRLNKPCVTVQIIDAPVVLSDFTTVPIDAGLQILHRGAPVDYDLARDVTIDAWESQLEPIEKETRETAESVSRQVKEDGCAKNEQLANYDPFENDLEAIPILSLSFFAGA